MISKKLNNCCQVKNSIVGIVKGLVVNYFLTTALNCIHKTRNNADSVQKNNSFYIRYIFYEKD